MMQPEADGRTYACMYCKTRMQVAIAGEQIAMGMQLDLANADAFLARLGDTLTQGFSEHARVVHDAGRVQLVEIDLVTDRFSAKREGARVAADHKKVVRGIALKTTVMPLDAWLARLCDRLAEHANENARAGWVLGQLGGRRLGARSHRRPDHACGVRSAGRRRRLSKESRWPSSARGIS
jgi:hypothetical protein